MGQIIWLTAIMEINYRSCKDIENRLNIKYYWMPQIPIFKQVSETSHGNGTSRQGGMLDHFRGRSY